MTIRLLKVPYDSGHRCERMARGPGYLLANNIQSVFDGHEVSVDAVETTLPFTPEIQTAFDLARQISTRVRESRDAGDLAIVLSGNCNSAMGTIAGLGADTTGVLWFDGHGEFNTPETTTSGFLDGMPLAIATGRCWKLLAQTIPHFEPLPEENVILVGVRDMNPEEQAALESSGITRIAPHQLARFPAALEKLAARCERLYIHLDLDALDPAEATSNQWVAGDGLFIGEVVRMIREAGAKVPIAAAAVASLDPASDSNGRALKAAREALAAIVIR